MDHAETYRQTFARLGLKLGRKDGYIRKELAAAEARLGTRIPSALRQYFELAGRERQPNQAHNNLLAPDEWFLDDGKLAFLAENQNVVPVHGRPPSLQSSWTALPA